MMQGVNSSMIYFKNFCKCHNVPHPVQQLKKRINVKKKKELSTWHKTEASRYLEVASSRRNTFLICHPPAPYP
jgi:hypothetical protein